MRATSTLEHLAASTWEEAIKDLIDERTLPENRPPTPLPGIPEEGELPEAEDEKAPDEQSLLDERATWRHLLWRPRF